jgi:hypothetical protein
LVETEWTTFESGDGGVRIEWMRRDEFGFPV